MSKWLPVTGENASYWEEDSEIFLDEVALEQYLHKSIASIQLALIELGDAQYLIELFFEEESRLRKLKLCHGSTNRSGQRIYCGSALDLLGVDPCSPAATT